MTTTRFPVGLALAFAFSGALIACGSEPGADQDVGNLAEVEQAEPIGTFRGEQKSEPLGDRNFVLEQVIVFKTDRKLAMGFDIVSCSEEPCKLAEVIARELLTRDHGTYEFERNGDKRFMTLKTDTEQGKVRYEFEYVDDVLRTKDVGETEWDDETKRS